MKNKKKCLGFTLIELLGVVLILGIVILLSWTAISKFVTQINGELSDSTRQMIMDGTKDYINKNKLLYPKKEGNIYCISLTELVEQNLISEKAIANYDISNKKVKITFDGQKEIYEIVETASCEEVKLGVTIKLYGDSVINLLAGSTYNDAGALATNAYGSPLEITVRIQNRKTKAVLGTSSPLNNVGETKTYISGIINISEIGEYIIEYIATEGGITASTSRILNIKDDTPDIPILTGGSEEWYSVDREITATIGDNVDHYEYYISTSCDSLIGGTWQLMTAGKVTITEEGNKCVFVRGVSASGKYSPVEIAQVKIDKTPPTCVSSGGSTSWFITDRVITGTCHTTGESGCSGNTSKLYTIDTNSLESPGSVSSNAGLTVTCPADQMVKIDKTNPTLTITPTSVTITEGNNYNLSTGVTYNDPVANGVSSGISGTYTVKEGSTVITTTTTLQIGTYTLTYSVVDNAGNTKTATRTLIVEEEPYTCVELTTMPDIVTGMIPVMYNGTNWVKADTTNANATYAWYKYCSQKWANVVLVTDTSRAGYQSAAIGATVNEADVLAYYVWIPRYRYKVWSANNATSSLREIEIKFEDKTKMPSCAGHARHLNGFDCAEGVEAYDWKDSVSKYTVLGASRIYNTGTNGQWLTHPAFRFGDVEVNGFWISKFLISSDPASTCYTTANATNCNVTTINPRVKPNVPSWRAQSISNQWTTILKFKSNSMYGISTSNLDSHMMKNIELGAVAYLFNSICGKYGNTAYSGANKEIFINPSSTYITGRGGAAPSQASTTDTSGTASTNLYSYNGKACTAKTAYECTGSVHATYGLASSSTGNIYGVYDMSGGHSHLMSNMASSSTNYDNHVMNPSTAGTSFGSYTNATLPKKYYDIYAYSTTNTTYERGYLGDATKEVISNWQESGGGWFGELMDFIKDDGNGKFWMVR